MTTASVPPRVGWSGPPASARAGWRTGWTRVLAAGAALVLCALAGFAPQAAFAASYVRISGAGSTWSQVALDQWRSNVAQFGMTVDYAGTGSSDGRNQFRSGTVDFAVSEIPYGLTDLGVADPPPTNRGYAYMPIVAGGTAFMYNLKIGGRRVTNLRLSGEVLSKIFTGVIKQWNDPAIRADNPGLTLPARKVIPVVRSDGSGTSAQLTLWMSKRHAALWNDYCRRAGKTPPCGQTSNYPVLAGSGFVSQSGSLGVSGYVRQDFAEGAITYVEYSYAKTTGFPVAKVLNSQGYYVEPTSSAVAVGLLQAEINDNKQSSQYLTQVLDKVYDHPDRRAYPLSSYSYMILPTSPTPPMTNDKGKTLGAFGYYFLCEGQRQAEPLGYSPLPINLVQAGFEQLKKVPGVEVQTIDLKGCNNPTFSTDGSNTLAKNAPYPKDCDKKGTTQCADGTGGAAGQSTQVNNNAKGPSGGGNNGGNGNGNGTPTGGPSAGTTPSGGIAPSAQVDPATGELIGASTDSGGQQVVGTSLALAGDGWNMRSILMLLSGGVLISAVIAPPILSQVLTNRRRRRGDAA